MAINFDHQQDRITPSSGRIIVNANGSLGVPVGNTAQRTSGGAAVTGLIRFNTQENQFEGYDGTSWGPFGGGSITFADNAPTGLGANDSGTLWYDSGTTGELFVWTGTEFISTLGDSQATFVRKTFVADGNTNTFDTGGNSASAPPFVYLNGILLQPTTDYNYASGVVTFVNTPPNLSVVEVVETGDALFVGLESLGIANHNLITVDTNGNTTISGTLGVTGETTMGSAIVSDLTEDRVVLAGASGALEDSANLTFGIVGATATVAGTQATPSVNSGDQFSINGTTVTLTGTSTVTGSVTNPTVTATDAFSINTVQVTLTGTDLASVISDITGASIPNVTASNVANQLVLTGANVSIVVANVTNTPLTDLGITVGTTAPVGNLTSVISDITTASVASVVASDNGSSQLQLVGTDVDIVLADITNTPLASLGLTAGTTTRTGGTDTLTVTGNTAISGDITIGGNIILGDAATDSITVTADFASHLIPDADVTYDLGASGKAWRDLYVGGTSIYLGTLILKDDGLGNLLAVNSSNQPVNITGAALAGTQLDIDNIRIDGNAITSTDTDGNITITPDGVGEVVVSTLTVSDLTDNRIPIAGTSGAVGDDANFTFDGTTLTVGITTIEQATGNTTVGGTLDVTGVTNINDVTGSTGTTTGALIVDGGAGIAENLYVGANLNVIGNTTLGDTDSDTLTVTAKVASNLIPSTAATHNLGSTTDTWNNLYLGGNLTAPNLFTIDPVTVSSSTTNYTVTVASGTLYGGGTGNVFYLENTTAGTSATSNPALTLYRGNTYVFDVSDSSNNNHPLRFTADGGTTEYTDGVTASGQEGQANATVTFVVPTDAPGELNYYCTVHGTGMGNEIITRNLAGTVIIAGDLQVDGSQTTINSTTLDVDDLNITIAKGAANAAAANGAGLSVDGANATLTYLSATDTWDFNKEPTFNGTSLLSSSSGVFKTFAVTDTDVIYSYTVTGNFSAANSTDTVTFVSGNGIDIDIDTTQKAIRVEHADTSTVSNVSTGNANNTFLQELVAQFDTFGHVTSFTPTMGTVNIQNNYGAVEVSDTDSGYTWAATGTVTAAQEADTIKFISGDAIDIDADAASYAIKVTHGDTSSITDQTAATNTFLTAQTYDTYGHVQTNTFGGIDFNVAGNYAFGEIAVSGQTTVTPNTNTQTLTLVNGTGITITTDNTAKEITVTNSDRGSSQDIIKSIIAVDTDAGLSFAATGTYTVSGNTDSFTFYGDTAIDVDIDTTNGALRIKHDVSGANTTIASATNTFVDAITVDAQGHVTAVASGNIDFNVADNYAFKTISDGTTNAVADSNTDTFKLRAGDQIEVTVTNDDATHGDNVLFGHADSGVSAGSKGSATEIPVVTVDAQGHVTALSTATPLIFKTFAVNGTNLVADSATDTLTVTQGSGIALTGTANTDTMEIAHADTSSISNFTVNNSGNTFIQDYAITFDTFGHVQSISQTSTDVNFNVSDNYAFKTITDGSNNAVADSNTDTFKLRAGDQIEVTVTNDDATHGDNVLFGHTDSGVTANTYGGSGNLVSVTVDAQGHVTALSDVALNTDFTITDDASNTQTVSLGNTVTFSDSDGMSVVVGATDKVTFTNTDRGSQQNIVKSFEVIDSDPGGTSFSETGTISASSNTDTIKLLGGTNIDLDVDTTNKIIRVDSTGSASDVFKTITVTDTNTGYTWSETGNVVASGTTDTLTLVSGTGIDLDVDASNQAILVQISGAGNAFTQYNFTGDGSNQTFNTGSTNIVDVQVYVNGVLIRGSGTDYTFTNATGVLSMIVAPLNGDEVTVIGYQSSSDPVTLQQLNITNHNLVTVDNSGNVTISGNLIVSGSQSSGSSQTLSDPIITLGGANPPTSDDNNDRGVVFRWHDGTANTTAGGFAVGVEYEIITTGTTDFTLIGAADSNPGTVFTATGAGGGSGTALATSAQKLGFFGFDDTDQFFQFIPDSSATGNVYTGTLGDAKFGGVKSGNIQIGVTGDNEIDTTSGNLTIDSTGGTTTIDDNASVSGTFEVTGGNSTFTGHLLPSADVTYDLGGATTQRWRDLYLSGTSIELGGATITASGSAVVLPAGSTIAGAGTILDSTTSDTDDLSEGSSNLYYTNTRVQTYIGSGNATNISISGNLTVDGNTTLGDANTDTITMNARISGTNALRFDGSSSGGNSTVFAITDPTANRTITFKNDSGTVAFTSDIPTDNSSLTNGANYITLTDLSHSNASASGGGSISYDNTNGTITFTPPDLSSFLTSYTETDTLDSVTGRGATTSNGITVGSLNGHTIPGGTGTLALTSDLSSFITLTDLSVTTAANSGSGSLSYNNSNGIFTFTPPDLSSYLTSESDTLDSVTGRGATTTNDITVGVLRAKSSATTGTVRFGDGTTHSIARSTNDLTIEQTVDAGTLILNSAGDVTINIDQDNDNTGKKFQILTNGSTDLVTVKDDGTVGIGTDNPGGKLTSYTSATRFQSLQGAAADLEIVSDNATNPVALIKGTGTADLVNVFDDTTEVFTIVDGGSVGIGTDNPTSQSSIDKLNVQGGHVRFGKVTHIDGDGSKSTTTTSVISGLLKASYRTLKYTISLTRGTEYQASEVLIVHNGTDAWATVYGTIYTGTGPLASFDAAISGSNVQLLATMTSSALTSYNFQVMAIDT